MDEVMQNRLAVLERAMTRNKILSMFALMMAFFSPMYGANSQSCCDSSQFASGIKQITFGDGDSYFQEQSDDFIRLILSGSSRYQWSATYACSTVNNGFCLTRDAGSVTAPTITFQGDTNTGMWPQAPGVLGFTGDGVEMARLEDSADLGATETSLWIYILDDAALKQVSTYTDSSCGTGFKCLRVTD